MKEKKDLPQIVLNPQVCKYNTDVESVQQGERAGMLWWNQETIKLWFF